MALPLQSITLLLCVFIECSPLQVPSKRYMVLYCAMRDVDLCVA